MIIEKIRTGWFKQKWSFRIKAANGKVVAISEKYTNHKDMVDTLLLLQRDFSTAEVVSIDKNKKE